jgi:AAA+ superfamily predicted ATPase
MRLNINDFLLFIETTRKVILYRISGSPVEEEFAFNSFSNLLSVKETQQLFLLSPTESIIVLLALIPHIQPNFYDETIKEALPQGGEFPEFGGVRGSNHRGLLPTGETIQYILAGNGIKKRLQTQQILQSDSIVVKENILSIEPVKQGEPSMSGKVMLSEEYIEKILFNKKYTPSFSRDFPAKLLETKMEWDDLVLNNKTARQINDIKTWLLHNNFLLKDWEMHKKIKPGYRALFYGPSGTGKTLTTTLLGKQFNKDVFRIDLSQVVSKFIGETEKNLENIFNKAEHKDWILFFDEADALFGKRSNVQNAHDKYANQEVSYLLQRVESFSGLVILASNFKSNIDQAFMRRFNAIIHFPIPNAAERYQIWKAFIPGKASLAEDVDLLLIASKYELNGSAIVNAIHYASLQTIYKNTVIISKKDILEGIKQEYEKEERVFNG